MSLPSWFEKDREKQNARSQAQERKRAKETGGRVSAGSGSSWRSPQDNRTDEHMEQIKYTDRASYSLKMSEWEAIREDALRFGREPRLLIDFEKHGIRLLITEEM